MEKFIPYEKRSKKERRKLDRAKRQTWGELNPVTRKPENSKAYNRKKSQAWKRELPPTACNFFVLQHHETLNKNGIDHTTYSQYKHCVLIYIAIGYDNI